MVIAFLRRQPSYIFGLLIVGLLVWMSGTQTTQTSAPDSPFMERETKVKSFAVPEISIIDALAAIARGAVVIDVRARDVYEQGHIAGAVSVPLEELKRRAADYAKVEEQELIIYCGDGSTLGPEGTQALVDAGHANAKNLPTGYSGWKAAGHPVTPAPK